MSYVIRRADPVHAEQLLALYQRVYGENYPISFGRDREVMLRKMLSACDLWLMAVEEATGVVAGSLVFEIDYFSKIAKGTGLVVAPETRGQNLGLRLVTEGSDFLMSEGRLNSIYVTTRTNAIGVQRIFLKAGYFALGIFPNAHRLQDYETLTLFVKYHPSALERRAKIESVPSEVGGILDAVSEAHGIQSPWPRRPALDKKPLLGAPLQFEVIYAPNYVQRLFDEKMADLYDRFFPFHKPNLLLGSTDGSTEIYAYFSKQDRYCAIVSLNVPIATLSGRLYSLLGHLKDLGISYIEILIGLNRTASIEVALQAEFVPSAIYPAMREEGGKLHDFIILSRTMEPLNFSGMAVDRAFKPFIDQYVRIWSQKHLMALEIYDAK